MIKKEKKLITLKDLVEDAKEGGVATSIESFTCYNCAMWKTCRSAFDLYNTNGDCLEDK